MCGREEMNSAAWEVERFLALVLPSRRHRPWSGLLIPFSFGGLRSSKATDARSNVKEQGSWTSDSSVYICILFDFDL